ncbi:hypothetical protein C8J57DRAFT_1477593 [Mycena rebaudengoi]|nr:hypothetical protein C8J57DRAFT_1477593 [Mycena rebaudengoi]
MEDFVPPPPPQCPHIPGHLLAICVLDFEAVLSPGLLQDYILSLQIGTHFLISTYAEKLPLWALHLPAPAWAVSLLVWALLIGVALYEYWDVLLVWLGPFATAPHRQPQTPRRRSPQRAVPIDKVELLSSANAAGQSNVTPSVPTLVAYVLPSPAHVLWLGSSVATPTRRQQVATMLSPEARQLVDMTADVLMGRDDIQTPVFFLEEDKENIPLSDSSVAATRSDPFLVSSADLLDVGGALALASPGPSQWRGFLANAASPNQRLVEERHKRQVLDSYEVRYTSGSHSERVGAVRDEEVQHSETPRLSVLQMALKYEADRGRDAKGKGKAVEPSAAQLGAVKATIQAWAVDPPTLRNVQAWEMLRPEEDFVSGIVVPAAQMLTIDEILNERR